MLCPCDEYSTQYTFVTVSWTQHQTWVEYFAKRMCNCKGHAQCCTFQNWQTHTLALSSQSGASHRSHLSSLISHLSLGVSVTIPICMNRWTQLGPFAFFFPHCQFSLYIGTLYFALVLSFICRRASASQRLACFASRSGLVDSRPVQMYNQRQYDVLFEIRPRHRYQLF